MKTVENRFFVVCVIWESDDDENGDDHWHLHKAKNISFLLKKFFSFFRLSFHLHIFVGIYWIETERVNKQTNKKSYVRLYMSRLI